MIRFHCPNCKIEYFIRVKDSKTKSVLGSVKIDNCSNCKNCKKEKSDGH